MIAQSVKQAN